MITKVPATEAAHLAKMPFVSIEMTRSSNCRPSEISQRDGRILEVTHGKELTHRSAVAAPGAAGVVLGPYKVSGIA